MRTGEQISVTITKGKYAGRTLLLDVEDYMPVGEAGWDCGVEICGETVWFFVSGSGAVYDGDDQVGICPAQEAEAEKIERELCGCGDPADCAEGH